MSTSSTMSDDPAATALPQANGQIATPAITSPTRATQGGSSSTTNTPPSSSSHQRSESHTPSDGIKSKLLSHVENRPDREQLMKRNIMKAYDHNTDPKLQGVMSSLIKTQTEDRLAQGLNKRRSVQELVAQGILMDQSKGTISVQLAQRALLRQMERDRLSAFLTKRPTLDELVKQKSTLMEDTMTWVKNSSLTGSIPLPRNCLSEDSRILTEEGFLFLDEILARTSTQQTDNTLTHSKHAELKYACYNSLTQAIEYHPGELIVKEEKEWKMVEFTNRTLVSAASTASFSHPASATSPHSSLLVTEDHDMWVAPVPATSSASASFSKVRAKSLLHCAAGSIQMLSHAASGRVDPTKRQKDRLRRQLDEMGIQNEDQLVTFFHSLRSAQELPTWTLSLLDAEQCGQLLDVFFRPCLNPASVRTFTTPHMKLRDQLIQLSLHAGFSAWFSRDENSGETEWIVSVLDPSVASPSIADASTGGLTFSPAVPPSTPASPCASHAGTIFPVSTYTGRVWCVSVPTGLILAQRAWKDSNNSKHVTHATRPLIIGNCHTMTSFPDSEKLYLLGGYGTGSTTNTDLLILDTSNDTWIRPPVGGSIPCERYSHTCSSLGNGKLIVFGGFSTNGVWLNDVYVLDTQVVQSFYTKLPQNGGSNVVSASNTPSKSSSQVHSPVHGPQKEPNSATTGGGGSGNRKTTSNKTSSPHHGPAATTTMGSGLNSASPPFQPLATPSQLQNGTQFGSPTHSSSHAQLQQYSSTTNNNSPHHQPQQHSTVSMLMWQTPLISGTPPSPRAAHACVVYGEKLIIFGGNDGQTLFNDLHVLDTATWTWSQPKMTVSGQAISAPSPRAGHTMNLVNGRSIVLFGGGTTNGPVNDLYMLEIGQTEKDAWVWSKPKTLGTPPSPRAGHTSCKFFSGQLLVFGGGYLNKVFNDLHLFNVDTLVWSRPADTGTVPTPRAGHSANVIQSRIYVFAGGDSEHVYNDVHILDTAFLKVQQQAAALLFHSTNQHHHHSVGGSAAGGGVTGAGAPVLGKLGDEMSSLSLGRNHHHLLLPSSNVQSTSGRPNKSQSAPSSPAHRSISNSSGQGGGSGDRASGEVPSLSLTGSSDNLASQLSVGSATSQRIGGGGGGSLDASSTPLSMDAVSKLLAAQVREREESELALVQRVDEAFERVSSVLRGVWVALEGEHEGGGVHQQQHRSGGGGGGAHGSDDALASSILRLVRSHRQSQHAPVKDALAHAQTLLQGEQAALRQLVSGRRMNGVGGAPSSVLSTLSSGAASPGNLPNSPYSLFHSGGGGSMHAHVGSGIMLVNGSIDSDAPIGPNGGPIVPNMYRSSSADGAMGEGGGGSSASHPIHTGRGGGSKKNSMITVKPVSVSNSSSALNSPSACVPPAPGPPGPQTPGKSRRKRGNMAKKRLEAAGGSGGGIGMDQQSLHSASSSLAGTPVMRPLAGGSGEGMAVPVPGHSSGLSKSSMSSGSSISPTNQVHPPSEIPPRHASPNSSNGSDGQ